MHVLSRHNLLLLLAATLLTAAKPGVAGAEEGVVNLDSLRLTVLYDNTAPRLEGLTAEWGFACLVETGEHRFLFDTGSSGVVRENMRELGIDPSTLEAVVISHNHWDHIGGLPSLLGELGDVPVILPKRPDRTVRKALDEWGGEVRIVEKEMELFPGVRLTRTLPAIEPERSLVLVAEEGTLIVAGCSHPGVPRILDEAAKITGKKPLLYIGGFHLGNASDRAIRDVIEAFRTHGISYVVPTHCTGDRATELIREAFGERYLRGGAGTVLHGADLRN